MTRALEGRVARLETKRLVHDDDLTRLSDAELDARIVRLAGELAAHHGGMANAVEALRDDPDPRWRPMADFLAERLAEDASA
jgi:hypothetical protein